MADTTQQDALGRAVIKSAIIYNKSGTSLSVVDNLLSVQIHEDIFTPFVTCEMMLIDYELLAKSFPLVGEEFFEFSFHSAEGKIVKYTFFLSTNDTGASNEMSSLKAFVLRGVTLERAFDSAKTVGSAYSGSYASMAAQIFDDYCAVDAEGQNFNWETSRGVSKYIVPQVPPLYAIEYCRQRAVPLGEARTPYVCFRNSEGYHFTSVGGLFNRSAAAESARVTHTFAATQLPAEMNDNLQDNVKVDIIEFDVATLYDTTSKVDLGGYNSDSFSFDLTTKSFVLRKRFNLIDGGDNFPLGGRGFANRKDFARLFANTRCVAYYTPTDCGWELPGPGERLVASTDLFPDYIGEMNSYMQTLTEYNVHYTMYGDSNVTAGQVMKINVPQTVDTAGSQNRGSQDKMLSGNFLCARVVHSFSFAENVDYYIRVSAINGARNFDIEDIKT